MYTCARASSPPCACNSKERRPTAALKDSCFKSGEAVVPTHGYPRPPSANTASKTDNTTSPPLGRPAPTINQSRAPVVLLLSASPASCVPSACQRGRRSTKGESLVSGQIQRHLGHKGKKAGPRSLLRWLAPMISPRNFDTIVSSHPPKSHLPFLSSFLSTPARLCVSVAFSRSVGLSLSQVSQWYTRALSVVLLAGSTTRIITWPAPFPKRSS